MTMLGFDEHTTAFKLLWLSGFPDLRFESKIQRIVGEQLVKLSFSPNR